MEFRLGHVEMSNKPLEMVGWMAGQSAIVKEVGYHWFRGDIESHGDLMKSSRDKMLRRNPTTDLWLTQWAWGELKSTFPYRRH